MRRASFYISVLGLCLAACSPRLDWRQVQDAPSGLELLLPCKPERATRTLALPDGRPLPLHVLGCEAGGGLYALSYADAQDEASLAQLWAAWPAAVRLALQAPSAQEAVFRTPGLLRADRLLQLRAEGLRPDARPVQAELMWVARERRVVHMAVYLEQGAPAASEPFWEGLKWP